MIKFEPILINPRRQTSMLRRYGRSPPLNCVAFRNPPPPPLRSRHPKTLIVFKRTLLLLGKTLFSSQGFDCFYPVLWKGRFWGNLWLFSKGLFYCFSKGLCRKSANLDNVEKSTTLVNSGCWSECDSWGGGPLGIADSHAPLSGHRGERRMLSVHPQNAGSPRPRFGSIYFCS